MRIRSLTTLLLAIGLGLSACTPVPPNGTVPASSSSSTAADVSNLIRNVSVRAGDTVTSGVTVTGEARGTWYFEASFPVTLADDNGAVIVQTAAEAQGEWMTEDFVPFSVNLTFTTQATHGTLILKNDNPSGEPANEKSLEIPVNIQ